VGNIQDAKKIKKVFANFKPDYVFHAAAYKHVPIMQSSPDEAVKNNVFGTNNLSEAALKFKVKKFINISTDKAADPSSVMGTTKFLAENIVRSKNDTNSTNFISVRFGNVLDSNGSVVPIFRKQIAGGGPVTITDPKMTRYFMTIPEAVQLVLEASILGKGGEIFVLDMGQPIKIEEMARLMIKLSGLLPDTEIEIKYIGIRPGEKLEEILHTPKESLETTANKKIFKIKQVSPKKDLKQILDQLKKLVYSNRREDLIHFLKRIAPNLQT
jgi:FlaA1/EpsC-like NDP-sugar epimerase